MTTGPGSTHLVAGLLEANRDHAPVLALSGEMPRNFRGVDRLSGHDPDLRFRDLSLYTETISSPGQAAAVQSIRPSLPRTGARVQQRSVRTHIFRGRGAGACPGTARASSSESHYVALACACGAAGFRVAHPGELCGNDRAGTQNRHGPVVIDCAVVPNEMPDVPHFDLDKAEKYAAAKVKEAINSFVGRLRSNLPGVAALELGTCAALSSGP